MLKIKAEGVVESWTLARPERRNGIGPTLAAALQEGLHKLQTRLATSNGPRVLVVRAATLTKNERRTWIAGGDLKELADLVDDGAAAANYAATMSGVCAGLSALPIPVIMVVDGAAIGGGAELMLSGDLRLASVAGSVELRQLDVGLATGYGGCKRLVDLVGLAKAQYLLFSRATLTAAAAQELGLFHEVHPDAGALEEAVQGWIACLARLAPAALQAQKAMLFAATNAHPGAAAQAERDAFATAWGNPHHREFLAHFSRPRSSAT